MVQITEIGQARHSYGAAPPCLIDDEKEEQKFMVLLLLFRGTGYLELHQRDDVG